MKKCILAAVVAVLICAASVAYAEVDVQYDQISAYMDSTGGIILTGVQERLNDEDASELISIDTSRVVFSVESESGRGYDIKTVLLRTSDENVLVSGVAMAESTGTSGVYYVPSDDTGSVKYISFAGVEKDIFTSEETVEYLQASNHGLIIGLADFAGAMVYEDGAEEAVDFNGLTGKERVICGDSDIVLTSGGALYLDSPALVEPALISGAVSDYAALGNYIYYIYDRNGMDMLMQYSTETLTNRSISLGAGRTPVSVTASFASAMVMDDTGMVYTINSKNGAVSQFASITPPEGYAVDDMFIEAVSGQMNVYAARKEEKQDILVFDFMDESDEERVEPEVKAQILLLASCPLKTEMNTNDVLFSDAVDYATLSYGSRGDAVRDLQQALTDLGYLNDRVDGIFGPKTRYAVRLFQDFNGLYVNGIADADMQKLLLGGDAPEYDKYRAISYGARGLRVQEMQIRLRELGYMADPADSIYGPYTRDGVSLFQWVNGLDETGSANSATLKKLYSSSAPICTEYFNMKYGDSGWRVLDLNRRLEKLYYLDDSAGYSYNSGTKVAIKLFQQECGLVQSGVATVLVQQKLFSRNAPEYSGYVVLRRGDENDRVLKLQKRLKELGYFDKRCSGYFGSGTVRAVRAFQKVAGLKESGIATVATKELLYSKNAPKKPEPATITAPSIKISEYITQPETGLYYVDDVILTISWTTEGSVKNYYVEILDDDDVVIQAGALNTNYMQLDVTALEADTQYRINVYAIPVNGTMDDAKKSSVYIVTPVRNMPTPEPTPIPTPIVMPTVEPTVSPEPTKETVKAPMIIVRGDVIIDGNAYVIGSEGASVEWEHEEGVEYNLYIRDNAGNITQAITGVSDEAVVINEADLTEDSISSLEIVAYPEGANEAEGLISMLSVRPEGEPDPTEPPAEDEEYVSVSVSVEGAELIGDVWNVGEEPATVSWTGEGAVNGFIVETIDYQGNVLANSGNVMDTMMTVSADDLIPGNVIGIRITACGEKTSADQTVYVMKPMPEATEEPVTEEPEVTEEPVVEEPEVTEEPAVEEPEVTEEPVVEETVEIVVTVENAVFENGVYYVGSEPVMFEWYNTGDATLYDLVILDKDGNELQKAENQEYTAMSLKSENFAEGVVYELRIIAHATSGDTMTSLLLTAAPAVEEPEVTEEPVVEEPEVTEEPAVEEPEVTEEPVVEETELTEEPVVEETVEIVVTVENAVFENGVYYVGSEPVMFEWYNTGDATLYDLVILDKDGNEIQKAENQEYTAMSLKSENFAEGVVYELRIIAHATSGDAMTSLLLTAAPAVEEPEVTEEPVVEEPEVTEEPVVEEPEVTEEPVVEEPEVTEEPVVEEPEVTEEPVVEEPEVTEEPVVEEPEVTEEPAVEEPEVTEEPVVEEPEVTEEPVAEEPEVTEEPVVEEPVWTNILISVENAGCIDDVYYVGNEPALITWSADVDGVLYDIYLLDENGNEIYSVKATDYTSLNLARENLSENAVYAIGIAASADGVYGEAYVNLIAEPVVEEPVVEEPVVEEPVVEEPVVEEPVVEEPVAEEPVVEEPADEEPVVEDTVVEEPVVEEPVVEEPVVEEPVVEEPVVEEPVVEEPADEEYEVKEPEAEEYMDDEEGDDELKWEEKLNRKSDVEHITAYQYKLQEWGWLTLDPMDPECAIEGEFDEVTMNATLAMQEYINSLYADDPSFVPLKLIDFEKKNPAVHVDTLQLIMDPELIEWYINPESDIVPPDMMGGF